MKGLHESVEGAVDPLGVAAPIVHAQLAWLAHPQELAERASRLYSDLCMLHWHAWRRAMGLKDPDPVTPHEDDTRFSDPVWTESATWDIVKEFYLAFTRHTQDMLYATPALSSKERRRAAFWWRKWLNAVAPTNFFWTNPEAIRRAVESRGESLVKGLHNLMDDMQSGDIRMTDPGAFKVGVNLATTAGEVVFRNPLLEVIHYAPTQVRVHACPVVIITPWINKFYILDLNPKKSLIRYLLDQGFDVFITSWKNPGAEMAGVSFDDYLTEGVATIVDVARRFTGSPKVHGAGYCIGGTALTMYMAWANRKFGPEAVPVEDWTLFTTLVDFRRPGDIEVFVDEGSVSFLTANMARKGYLDGKEMAAAFRLLRSNSLIWHYVVHGWLYGESPPPFDVLFWNMDTTRMPYRMHSWYLRELYLYNRLIVADALKVAGQPLDLSRISQPLYSVAAQDDHIAPAQQTFYVHNHVTGPKRFVLSSSGHILGVVNPPVDPPKRHFWSGEAHRSDSFEAWRGRAQEHVGSWWPDWVDWLRSRSGELVEARPAVTAAFPSLGSAPGSYVLEQ
ncbi:MAG: alpha/beta hydrolase [Rhodocyclaceae bacterium]|nr:alpha/beta hydrolase [Rhodocyclaceae bacterium]